MLEGQPLTLTQPAASLVIWHIARVVTADYPHDLHCRSQYNIFALRDKVASASLIYLLCYREFVLRLLRASVCRRRSAQPSRRPGAPMSCQVVGGVGFTWRLEPCMPYSGTGHTASFPISFKSMATIPPNVALPLPAPRRCHPPATPGAWTRPCLRGERDSLSGRHLSLRLLAPSLLVH